MFDRHHRRGVAPPILEIKAKLSSEGHTHAHKHTFSKKKASERERDGLGLVGEEGFLLRDHGVNLARLHASLTIAELVSLRNPLHSSRGVLAFSLIYINISLVRPPLFSSPPSLFFSPALCSHLLL